MAHVRQRRSSLPRCAGFLVMLGCSCAGSQRNPPAASADSAPADTSARSDALLLEAAKVALPPPGITAADLPERDSPGAGLLVTYCQQCHALPTPTMHSATDWPRVLRRMWLRMDQLPDSLGVRILNEGERVNLLNYLTANALRVSGETVPAGPGREDFVAMCSRCHALPDVKTHSSKDWATVYLRMERNMERMKVSLPTPDQAGRIVLYLQETNRKS